MLGSAENRIEIRGHISVYNRVALSLGLIVFQLSLAQFQLETFKLGFNSVSS